MSADPSTTVEFVLGTAQLRARYGVMASSAAPPDEADASDLLTAGRAFGVDALDTAPAYGEAEATIGRSGVMLPVHTKIDPALTPQESISGSLGRLRTERVDIAYLHDASEVTRRDSTVIADAATLTGDVIGSLGASIYDSEQFDAAVRDPRITVVQIPCNILDRHIDDRRLMAARDSGTAVYARSVLLQGILVASPTTISGPAARLRPAVEEFHRLATALGRPPLELALGWVRHRPGVRGVVIGADSISELDALTEAFRSCSLEADEIRALTAIDLPDPALCDPRRWSTT